MILDSGLLFLSHTVYSVYGSIYSAYYTDTETMSQHFSKDSVSNHRHPKFRKLGDG